LDILVLRMWRHGFRSHLPASGGTKTAALRHQAAQDAVGRHAGSCGIQPSRSAGYPARVLQRLAGRPESRSEADRTLGALIYRGYPAVVAETLLSPPEEATMSDRSVAQRCAQNLKRRCGLSTRMRRRTASS